MHDTVTIHTDSIITQTRWKTKWDTITEIQYKDTVLYDTIYLDIEYKVSEFELKKDSLTIHEKIHHHGFKSEIDSVEFSYDWQYTFQPKKKKKIQLTWTIGPAIGYGFGLNGNTIVGTPYLGIGATIGFGNVIEMK